jgi:hypothetical protein
MAVKILVNTVRVGQTEQTAGTRYDTASDADLLAMIVSAGGVVVDPTAAIEAAAQFALAARLRGEDVATLDAYLLAASSVGGGGGGGVPPSRTIVAGAGLVGGGDLSVDRMFACAFGSGAGQVCEGNDARLSDARTPLAHAVTHVSGGSDPIPDAVPSGTSGLMSGADKAKLDGLISGHVVADHGTTMPQRSKLYMRGVYVDDDLVDDHTLLQTPLVMTSAQRAVYARAFAGCVVFDTTLQRLTVYTGSAWRSM